MIIILSDSIYNGGCSHCNRHNGLFEELFNDGNTWCDVVMKKFSQVFILFLIIVLIASLYMSTQPSTYSRKSSNK